MQIAEKGFPGRCGCVAKVVVVQRVRTSLGASTWSARTLRALSAAPAPRHAATQTARARYCQPTDNTNFVIVTIITLSTTTLVSTLVKIAPFSFRYYSLDLRRNYYS